VPAITYVYLLTADKGVADGAATLEPSGYVPLSQLSGILASNMTSSSAVNGSVLKADGSGGASYGTFASDGDAYDAFLLMGM
jgi:hypothetical protein